MSLTFVELLGRAVSASDNEAAVDLLEPKVRAGAATDSERLLCGVLLLMPPLGDPEAAAGMFQELFAGPRGFEAAVWDAYRFSVLLPKSECGFEQLLRSESRSAVAAHMLSMVCAARGDMDEAVSLNRRSCELRLFPFNIMEALKRDPSMKLEERKILWRSACDLIVSRSAESDVRVVTIEGAIQRHWDNLISGIRLSSPMWEHYVQVFGPDIF